MFPCALAIAVNTMHAFVVYRHVSVYLYFFLSFSPLISIFTLGYKFSSKRATWLPRPAYELYIA